MGSVATPIPDRAAAAALGTALRRLGYVEDELDELLDEDAFKGGREEVLVAERRLPASKLGTAVRLLFLQLPVPEAEAVDALGRPAVAALAATGLAELLGDVVPHARLVPIGDVLLASDGFTRDADDPPDYVASYTPTARTCDLLTVRKRGKRALDVGTGSGIHALLAARHHRHVVAVDVNPRALAYTALNAALNGLDNVECRPGSFFEPAAGETYDLITCNAPYVVSPENRWTYRDSDFHGDDVSAHVVAAAAAHLAQGGYATMLGSWLVTGDGDSEERPVAWVEETGCDGWVLASQETDALGHAVSWNAEFFGDTATYTAALDEWTRYLAELGARAVAEGAILLHRRGAERATVRVDEIDEESLEPAGTQIRRAFANRARLEGMQSRDLPAARLARAMPLNFERALGKRSGELALDGGTRSLLPATKTAAGIVERLDGKATLSRLGADRAAVSLCRELLELGALRFA
jgi:methylase of polypeptide subunit release factors